MNQAIRKAKLFMDTVVEITVVSDNRTQAERAMEQAFLAFRKVEDACSRFSPDSELSLVCSQTGVSVPVSPYLYQPLRFAMEIAEATDGLFDPTVGAWMERHGFNRHYLSGELIHHPDVMESASYRDVQLTDHGQGGTVRLIKPLVLDLGAVAKGFAIDLAAGELKGFDGFLVNAGGDLYAGGRDESGEDWTIGIQHPLEAEHILTTLQLSDAAICTSGSYERRSEAVPGAHHLVDPHASRSPSSLLSSSVIAPFAMLADALSTVTFLLGLEKAVEFIENEDIRAIFITESLDIVRVGEGGGER